MKSLWIRRFAFAAALTSASCLAFAQTSPSNDQQEHFERTFSLDQGGTLHIENYKGRIRIKGSDAKQVTVTVDRRFEGTDKDRAWWMSHNHVNFGAQPGRLSVEVEYPNNNCSNLSDCYDAHEDYTAWVELTLQVPRQVNLQIDGYKPEMNIDNIEGDIRIKSYKSPIDIASTTGAIRIDTYKDSIHLRDVAIRGHLYVKSEKADAVVEAKSLGDDVELETEKGSIILRVPQGTGMDVDYSGGRRSTFHSDFNMNVASGYPPESLRGKINNGGAHVSLRTVKGSVSIEKGLPL
jgi:hypothetical protein